MMKSYFLYVLSNKNPHYKDGKPPLKLRWKIIKVLMKWRYGVRGALKPPLGGWYNWHAGILLTMHYGLTFTDILKCIWYDWRFTCWKIDSWLYAKTGLPEEWEKWCRPDYVKYG